MTSPHYKRAVIIGARGFIGRTLVREFFGHIETLPLDLPELDITNAASLAAARPALRAFAAGGPTVLINAAGLMDAALSRRKPDLFYSVNGTAVGHLKALALQAKIEAFLQLSSETVFGSGTESFTDDAPRVPQHPYGISKLLAELILSDDATSPATVGLRLPVVVGDGQVIGNPISIFCDEARKAGTITVFNGGSHRRKFVHVSDIARQILAVLSRPMEPGTVFYNVGGFIASMRQIAEIVSSKSGNIAILDRESKSQAFTLLSTSERIESCYGFRPEVTLDTMINEFFTSKSSPEKTA